MVRVKLIHFCTGLEVDKLDGVKSTGTAQLNKLAEGR